MVKVDIEVLKNRIDDAYDIDSVVDILGLSTMDILDAFEDILVSKRAEFSYLEIEEEEEND